MKAIKHVGKGAYALGLMGVIVVGVVTLANGRAAAGPLCGWSTLWDCTMPNGTHRMVGGTPCDVAKFEKSTGAHCVPSGL